MHYLWYTPRKHIWTFAAGAVKLSLIFFGCPCINSGIYTGIVPPFVGRDSLTFNNPPRFCKQLPQPTTDFF